MTGQYMFPGRISNDIVTEIYKLILVAKYYWKGYIKYHFMVKPYCCKAKTLDVYYLYYATKVFLEM